jgi:fission process protein 1
VPALPYLFDEPVEKAVDGLWQWAERRAGIIKEEGEKAKEKL